MPTPVRSFCKINLGLAVGSARPDGFHALTTIYQTLGLHDRVTISASPARATRITVEADHPAVPSTATGDGGRNTAFRIVAGALDRLGLSAEVHIAIEKRLPVQGGLGAGSANAAAALLGLERELNLAMPPADRLALAAGTGSDVPLFLVGGTVLGLNRGEAVYPLPDSPALPVVVAVPEIGVSTAQAFRDLDLRLFSRAPGEATGAEGGGRGNLTSADPQDRLGTLSRVLASAWTPVGCETRAGRVPTGIANSSSSVPAGEGDLLPSSGASGNLHGSEGDLAGNPLLALVRTGVENDFEAVAFRQHPSLRDIKRALEGPPGATRALYAALSGSGSALFGIYGSAEAAREAQQRVQHLGARALLTETLGYREYWQRMFA